MGEINNEFTNVLMGDTLEVLQPTWHRVTVILTATMTYYYGSCRYLIFHLAVT